MTKTMTAFYIQLLCFLRLNTAVIQTQMIPNHYQNMLIQTQQLQNGFNIDSETYDQQPKERNTRRQSKSSKKRHQGRESKDTLYDDFSHYQINGYLTNVGVNSQYNPSNYNPAGSYFSSDTPSPVQDSHSFLLVPYPYPIVITDSKKTEESHKENIKINEKIMTTTEKTTTEKTTTTTVSPTTSTTTTLSPTTAEMEDSILKLGRNFDGDMESDNFDIFPDLISRIPRKKTIDKRNFVLTTIGKSKPNWIPKYGIVPIPDKIAERLLSQLKRVKALQTQRRRTISLTSL